MIKKNSIRVLLSSFILSLSSYGYSAVAGHIQDRNSEECVSQGSIAEQHWQHYLVNKNNFLAFDRHQR